VFRFENDNRTISAGCFGRPLRDEIARILSTDPKPRFYAYEGVTPPIHREDGALVPWLRVQNPADMTVEIVRS
jgi:hypothetical protein